MNYSAQAYVSSKVLDVQSHNQIIQNTLHDKNELKLKFEIKKTEIKLEDLIPARAHSLNKRDKS